MELMTFENQPSSCLRFQKNLNMEDTKGMLKYGSFKFWEKTVNILISIKKNWAGVEHEDSILLLFFTPFYQYYKSKYRG